MYTNSKKVVYRPQPRPLQTALLYAMRPDSTPDEPIWDLVRIFTYRARRDFPVLPVNDLCYRILSSAGDVLLDTSRPFATQH